MQYTCVTCGWTTEDYIGLLDHLLEGCEPMKEEPKGITNMLIAFFLAALLALSSCATIEALKPGESREVTAWGVFLTMDALVVGYWHSYRGPLGGREDSAKPGDVIKPR